MNLEKSRKFGPSDPFFMEKWPSQKSASTLCPCTNRVTTNSAFYFFWTGSISPVAI